MILDMFSDALKKTVDYEKALEKDMFRSKRKGQDPDAFNSGLSPPASPPTPQERKRQDDVVSAQNGSDLGSVSFDVGSCVETPFGKGKLVKKRRACYESTNGKKFLHLRVNEIVLDFGGTLYRPDPSSVTFNDSEESPTDESDTKTGESFSLDTESSYIGKFLLFGAFCKQNAPN